MMSMHDQFIRCTVVLGRRQYSAPACRPLADGAAWISEGGMAVYETEIGDMAVFSVPLKGERVRSLSQRTCRERDGGTGSKSHGYWIGTGKRALQRRSGNTGRHSVVQMGAGHCQSQATSRPFRTGLDGKVGKCQGEEDESPERILVEQVTDAKGQLARLTKIARMLDRALGAGGRSGGPFHLRRRSDLYWHCSSHHAHISCKPRPHRRRCIMRLSMAADLAVATWLTISARGVFQSSIRTCQPAPTAMWRTEHSSIRSS